MRVIKYHLMRTHSFLYLASYFALLLLPFSLSAQQGSREFSLQELTLGEFYPHNAGRGFRSTGDGTSYTQLVESGTVIEQYRFASGVKEATLINIPKLYRSTELGLSYVDDYIISPTGTHIVLLSEQEPIYRRSSKAKAFLYDVKHKALSRLSDKEGKVMLSTFSPDGRKIAFVRDNNIYVYSLDSKTEVEVTDDGLRNHIINGATDWVYEEEFSCTALLSFSPDSRYLAYARTDESQVKEYSMPLYTQGLYPGAYTYKYPKAGEVNSSLTLWVYDLDKQRSQQVNLPALDGGYLPRIDFIPGGHQLVAFTLNRHQNKLELHSIDAATLQSQVVLTDTDPAYIKTEWIQSCQLLKDGFILVSERDGYAHIYRFDRQGKQTHQLTRGAYDVLTLYGVDTKGTVFYQAADKTPIARRVLAVDTKGKRTVLAGKSGCNEATFSRDMSHALITHSSSTTTPSFRVCRSSDGKVLRTLEDNQALAKRLQDYSFREKEFFQLSIEGGHVLHGWMIKPTQFDPHKQYPLVMVQYSGPDSQEVLDRWELGWEYYMAQQGFVVACVDGRGTGARGREWRKCTYLKLGQLEVADQVAAARALGAMPFIDAERIGIWGWSFGGYMTLMSLTHTSGVFKSGVAIAPVADWRFYDTIYTERFMRTPQENPEGYRIGSALSSAANLKGNLLMIHGSADDNVHLQNYMLMAELLSQANIPFEMALYTDKDHSIYGGKTRLHLFSRVVDFYQRTLTK